MKNNLTFLFLNLISCEIIKNSFNPRVLPNSENIKFCIAGRVFQYFSY